MSLFLDDKTAVVEPPIDKNVLAADMLKLMKDGSKAGYFGPDDEGGRVLTKPHVKGLALAGRNNPIAAEEVYNRIIQDIKDMNAVNPCDFDLVDAYKSALDKVTTYVPVADYYTAKLADNSVTTFPALKNALAPVKEAV